MVFMFLHSNSVTDVEVINGTIIFPSESESGASDCFNVSIAVDSILEGDEVVTLSLSSPGTTGATVGGSIMLTIQDDADIGGNNHCTVKH